MTRITVKKTRSGEWGIYRNGRLIDTDISKVKAKDGAKFYRAYFKVLPSKRKEWVRKAKW